MPEHTHDPIRDLENFDSGGLAMTPLDPAQVRRLGDRRRTRRNALVVAAGVVAVVVALSPALLLNKGDGSEAPSPAVTTSPTPSPSSTPSPTSPTTTEPPQVITYPGGIEITSASDTAKLTGTTQEFRDFIAGELQKLIAEGSSCAGAAHSVTVQKYSSAGYAIGGVNSCGGNAELWADFQGQWQEGMGTQDAWNCDTLTYLGVPKTFAGDCFDEAGDFGPTGTDGIDLGMTAAEVEAAGGTVQDGGAGSCSTMLLPYFSPRDGSTDGYLGPDHKVVMIAARPGVTTPEAVGLGSSGAKVRQAYPGGNLSFGYWIVKLGHGTEYEFQLGQEDTVSEMLLADSDQPCTE